MKFTTTLFVLVLAGSAFAEQNYVVKFQSDGLEKTGWEATFDTAQQCKDHRSHIITICRLAYLPKGQVPQWVKDIVLDRQNPVRDICRHKERGWQSSCTVVSVAPSGGSTASAPPPPPPTYWRVWARPPAGTADRHWTMMKDGPFTNRYDCEAQIIKSIQANNITDHSVMDNFQCFEDAKSGSDEH